MLLALVALAMPALARDCEPSTTYDRFPFGPMVWTMGSEPGPTYYMVSDVCQVEGCLYSLWFYEETNGMEGLQRGDDIADDTCGGLIDSDTIVW